MSKLQTIAKDTAIYGLSSIIGRFLNYLLVPLYTAQLSAASGGYGVITNMYAYVALILVILTFGMETTYFRFTNKTHTDSQVVYSTTLISVGTVSLLFAVLVIIFITPISQAMGYGDHPDWVWVMALTVAIDAFLCIPFAYLRQQKKAFEFALLKLLNIIVSILLNLIYFAIMDGKHGNAGRMPLPGIYGLPLGARQKTPAHDAQLLLAHPRARHCWHPEPDG